MTDLWGLPATAIAALVRSRAVSAREAVTAALARLEAANGPINAVVDPLPEAALAEADALDARIARGLDPGPLAGVPVTVKVNIDMAGRATTNGLRGQAGLVATQNSPVIDNLRRAGAVVIGRTNTPAFSLRWFTRNALHGATRNPHDAGLTPGGSSGGAGAAVAAGIGAVAQGTDIAGSIRYPAHACNVHGLRPTLGRVANANLSAPDRTVGAQLTAISGPLARTIDDLEAAFDAMAARDLRDPWWVPVDEMRPRPARRVAVAAAPGGMETAPEVRTAIAAAARALEAAGWEVAEAEPPSFEEAAAVNMALWMEEFRATGLPRLEAEGDPDALRVAPRLMAVAADAPDALTALRLRAALVREWSAFLADWPVLLCPVSAEPPFPDHLDTGPDADWTRLCAAQVTQVGLPALGLPGLAVACGRPGRPMAVQLVGGRYEERHLLDAARAIEAQNPAIAPVDPFVAG